MSQQIFGSGAVFGSGIIFSGGYTPPIPPVPNFFKYTVGNTVASIPPGSRFAYNGVAYAIYDLTSTVAFSTNGNTWNTSSSFTPGDSSGYFYGGNNSTFIYTTTPGALSNLVIQYSTDNGNTFSSDVTVTGLNDGTYFYSPIYYQSGDWYCARYGVNDYGNINAYRIGNIANGASWTAVANSFANWGVGSGDYRIVLDPVTQQVMLVAAGSSGVIVIDGAGNIAFSNNSVTWSANRGLPSNGSVVPSDAAIVYSASPTAAYDGKFLIAWSNAAGGNGVVVTSNQGTTWNNCTGLPSDQTYTTILGGYANTYAAFTSSGNIYYSTDGISFTQDISQYSNIVASLSGNNGYVGADTLVSVSYSRNI